MDSEAILEFFRTWWWAFGVVAAFASFFVNYTRIVEWWDKKGSDKKAQPELAITIDSFRRNKMISPDDSRGYIPSDLVGKQLDFADRERIAFIYYFEWYYDIIIRNQTEHVALGLHVVSINEDLLGMVIDPIPQYTQPMIRGNDYKYQIIYRKKHRCTSEEADEYSRTYPVTKIRIEYTNTAKVKFATEYIFAEHDVTKKNVYLKVG